jgi:hypothetical protein
VHLNCWAEEENKFLEICKAEGIACRRGGGDGSTTPLDIITEDLVIRLRRKHLDTIAGPRFPASGYDEPSVRELSPTTYVCDVDATCCIKPLAFYQAASLVDLWRSELPFWKPVKVSLQFGDAWEINRLKWKEVSEGQFSSDVIADLDGGILVGGVALRLGSHCLLPERNRLCNQSLEFMCCELLTQCSIGSAMVKFFELDMLKRVV